ncbi:MAG: hypothetical protein M1358_00265 [Chloroflexi bacterium]|nr:hypothetical protein [Chloroflexota bacterium]
MPPKREEQWGIRFFQRHLEDDPNKTCPAEEFLASCPRKVSATLLAILQAVAMAPPPTFSGGGMWEAMHGEMAGFYEARTRGPDRRLYRLYCILERAAPGLNCPSLIVIAGLSKPNESAFSKSDYAWVRGIGDEYYSRSPRSVV